MESLRVKELEKEAKSLTMPNEEIFRNSDFSS
jgi:hypothetical protein